MDRREAGRLGGLKTACKYGINQYVCPEFGCLCPVKLEGKSEYYSRNGVKGGQKGMAVLRKKYTKEQMDEWAKRGGRPRKKKIEIKLKNEEGGV